MKEPGLSSQTVTAHKPNGDTSHEDDRWAALDEAEFGPVLLLTRLSPRVVASHSTARPERHLS